MHMRIALFAGDMKRLEMSDQDAYMSKGKPVDPLFWNKFWASYDRGILPICSLDQYIDNIKRKHYPEVWAWEQAQRASAILVGTTCKDAAAAQGGGVHQSSSPLNSVQAAACTVTVMQAAVTATVDIAAATADSAAACEGTTASLAKPNKLQYNSTAEDSTSLPSARWQLLRKCLSLKKASQEHGPYQSQQQQQQQLQDKERQLLGPPLHVCSNAAAAAAATIGSFQLASDETCSSSSQHHTPYADTPACAPLPHVSPYSSDSTLPQLSTTPRTADHSSSAWLQKETAEEAAANWAWRQSMRRAKYLLMFEELV